MGRSINFGTRDANKAFHSIFARPRKKPQGGRGIDFMIFAGSMKRMTHAEAGQMEQDFNSPSLASYQFLIADVPSNFFEVRMSPHIIEDPFSVQVQIQHLDMMASTQELGGEHAPHVPRATGDENRVLHRKKVYNSRHTLIRMATVFLGVRATVVENMLCSSMR